MSNHFEDFNQNNQEQKGENDLVEQIEQKLQEVQKLQKKVLEGKIVSDDDIEDIKKKREIIKETLKKIDCLITLIGKLNRELDKVRGEN